MKNKILDKIRQYKNIVIVGFGKEGISTYNLIRSNFKDLKLVIVDKFNPCEKMPELKKDLYVDIIYGDNYLKYLDKFDLIFKSPGVSFKNIDITNISRKITSQMEMFLEVNRRNVIGITGSKGKSTTSSLIYHLIKKQGKKTCLVGNIGIPVFEQLDYYTDDMLVVMEMSCNQLEFLDVSPHIGVVVNIFQDHLDTLGTLDNYEKSKMNMFLYQNEEDYGIYDMDNSTICRRLKEMDVKSNLFKVSLLKKCDCYLENNNIYLDNEFLIDSKNVKRKILGDHNLKNIMIVLKVIKLLGLDINKAISDIEDFSGLEHRMELVGTFGNITFFNDTIATIPEATILACETIDNLDTLIFGGMDRGIDYTDLINYLNESSIKNFICMPTTGYKLAALLDEVRHNVYKIDNLEDAVKKAYDVTEKGKCCLLSPSAASYEAFKNFEEKGKKYKEYIKLYSEKCF